MTILVFLLMALSLFFAARRWGVDTRESGQWEWVPPERDDGRLSLPR